MKYPKVSTKAIFGSRSYENTCFNEKNWNQNSESKPDKIRSNKPAKNQQKILMEIQANKNVMKVCDKKQLLDFLLKRVADGPYLNFTWENCF